MLPVNFNNIDKNIYRQNSVFFAGSFNNTAIKAAAIAATIISLSVSVYLVSAFGAVYGAILVSGTIIADAGGSVWYQYRINEIQNATRELFDQIFAHGQGEQMKAFLQEESIGIGENFFPKNFFEKELSRQFRRILEDKENFKTNILQLKPLLEIYYSEFSIYKYLANLILDLEDEDKTFILNQNSADLQNLIQDMMVKIRCKTTAFTGLYKFIPDSMRKNLLIYLGKPCHSSTFSLALKLTPDLPRIINEIFSENPQVKEQFCAVLSIVFSEEFSCVKEVETSAQFLNNLYPFLNESNIARAFYVDTGKENPLSLKLWMEVVSKTRAAECENFTDCFFESPPESPSFCKYLQSNWSGLKDNFKALCQDLPLGTPFSDMVIFLGSCNKDLLPKIFFKHVFDMRLTKTLRDKENFQKNFPQLISFVKSHRFLDTHASYELIAFEIVNLNVEDKTFILNSDSFEVKELMLRLMIKIRDRAAFAGLYKLIPDFMRKLLLIELGKCDSSKLFSLALKLTPEMPTIVGEIFSENPQAKEEFSAALSKVFSKEFNRVRHVEASAHFLIDLYPFLNESNIASAFYVNTEKENPRSLKLWMEVVSKTRAAELGNFTDIFFDSPPECPSFCEYLRSNWSKLEEDLNAMCRNLPVNIPFSLFVHFLSSGLSEEERAHVQEMSVSELGTLAMLDPGFIKVWMQNKSGSIREMCQKYIQQEIEWVELRVQLKDSSYAQQH